MPQKQPRKRPPAQDRPAVEKAPPGGNTGVRSDALTAGGNKIHGDKLEGMIPGKPEPRSNR